MTAFCITYNRFTANDLLLYNSISWLVTLQFVVPFRLMVHANIRNYYKVLPYISEFPA